MEGGWEGEIGRGRGGGECMAGWIQSVGFRGKE